MDLKLRPASLSTLRLLPFVLICALAALLLACGSKDAQDDGPNVVVQKTVEPLLADLPQFASPTPEPLPPLGSPRPEPWAAAPVLKASAAPPPEIAGIAAVVVDEASGAVLYDKNAHMPAAPASLTKIATLVLALEDGRLDDVVTTDVDSASMRGSTVMGLEPGDQFTLRDLLYGMMLPSGNDAALAIGRYVAGNDEAFVKRMNLLMRRLGLIETTWANPHGLDRGGTHMTSAYDLAMLSRYGMSLPGFKEIVNTRYYAASGSRTIPLANINNFINSYAGADGLKTGYTRRAGSTLAASATRNGHRLYAIVLNSRSREYDASLLLNWAYASYTWPQQ
jgi:D-alanyl-D-alanine carboxypeptidase (penicillin-binding protein 5/6)